MPSIGLTVLDLREKKPVENWYPLYVVRQLINNDSGRQLTLESLELLAQCSDFFKLVRFPDPMGFTIVANKTIPAGKLLCPYGGESMPSDYRPLEISDIEYLSRVNIDNRKTIVQQAKEFGDLGSLFAHLPDEDFLDQIELVSDLERIQTANVAQVPVQVINAQGKKEVRIFFQSVAEIPKDAIVGYSYGWEYWVERGISPVFFQRNSLNVLDASTFEFNALAALQTERGETRVLNTGTWESSGTIIARGLSFFRQFNQPETTAVRSVGFGRHEVVLGREEFERTLEEAIEPGHPTKLRLKQFLLFFKTDQVAGCAAPRGSRVDQNDNTVVPKNHR